MLTRNIEEVLNKRLNGSREGFLRDCELFGMNYAVSEYKLSDINFPELYDWAQKQSSKKILSQRGLLMNPQDNNNTYMEDLLDTIYNPIFGTIRRIPYRNYTRRWRR